MEQAGGNSPHEETPSGTIDFKEVKETLLWVEGQLDHQSKVTSELQAVMNQLQESASGCSPEGRSWVLARVRALIRAADPTVCLRPTANLQETMGRIAGRLAELDMEANWMRGEIKKLQEALHNHYCVGGQRDTEAFAATSNPMSTGGVVNDNDTQEGRYDQHTNGGAPDDKQ